jgi:taurine dioxygenase
MKVERLTGAIGAVIAGGDPTGSAQDARSLRQALLDHQVIFLRGTPLEPEHFQRFGQLFGELEVHPFQENLGGRLEYVHVISYDGSGRRGTYTDQWHSDVTFAAEPPMGSVLTPTRLPSIGGDTLWASMYAAYEALPGRLQRFIDGLTAVHALPGDPNSMAERDPESLRGRTHPVVRRHPETGRPALFVNSIFTRRIVEMGETEGRRILDLLFDHVKSPDFQVRWRWEYGDIVVWDNRCTQHYAVADYHEPRTLHRLTIKGDRPVGVHG